MSDADYRLVDLGDRRVLTVDGRDYATRYSEHVLKMLIARKGPRRAALYLPFKHERAEKFLSPAFKYLRGLGKRKLSVLEVGCSFGHMTEWLAETREVDALYTFDTDRAFVEITRTKVEELGLTVVRDVSLYTNEETCRLPYARGRFDLVLAIGVIEHLPARTRRAQVDEYYRVLAPGGHIAILDTPNRWFPIETHSIGLPLVQWLPPALAYRYARLGRPARFRDVPYDEFVADGTGWRNASLADCLPPRGWEDVEDVTEPAGYGWRFFRDTARSRARRAALPLFATVARALAATGRRPWLVLPYFNLMFRTR